MVVYRRIPRVDPGDPATRLPLGLGLGLRCPCPCLSRSPWPPLLALHRCWVPRQGIAPAVPARPSAVEMIGIALRGVHQMGIGTEIGSVCVSVSVIESKSESESVSESVSETGTESGSGNMDVVLATVGCYQTVAEGGSLTRVIGTGTGTGTWVGRGASALAALPLFWFACLGGCQSGVLRAHQVCACAYLCVRIVCPSPPLRLLSLSRLSS